MKAEIEEKFSTHKPCQAPAKDESLANTQLIGF